MDPAHAALSGISTLAWTIARWAGLAAVLFWAVGAYSRLKRLRTTVRQAFVALDAQLLRQLELLQSCLPAAALSASSTRPADLLDEATQHWLGVRSAALQFTASLAAARAQPLHAPALAALAQAHAVLEASWHRVAPAGDALLQQWEGLGLQARVMAESFNQAVAHYNAAITQFPALLLARLAGFRAAQPL